MNIVKNQIDELNFKLTITVAHDDYAETEKKELQKCKRTAEFKGFRKGMVPMSLIQRVYGERVLGDAVNKVLSDAINGYIKDNNIHMVGQARITCHRGCRRRNQTAEGFPSASVRFTR